MPPHAFALVNALGQAEFFVLVGKLRWVRFPVSVHPVKFDPSSEGGWLSNAEDRMCILNGIEAWTIV